MIRRLSLPIFRRGEAGVPSSVFVDNLVERAESYEHTISDQFGFESGSLTFTAPIDEGLWWMDQLMSGFTPHGPDADPIWDGFLTGVDLTVNGVTHSRSLDPMANRVRCRYTTYTGANGTTATASDTASQALYGVKDAVVHLNNATSSTDAAYKRDVRLALQRWPKAETRINLAGERKPADVCQIVLRFAGWYDTLGWVLTNRTDTTSEATTTQLGDLLAASGVGIGATNAFLATTTGRITASGVNRTRFIDLDTSYRSKIENLLSAGNGTSPYAWGVYEDRVFWAEPYAAATPTQIDYTVDLLTQTITDGGGNGALWPWQVRPNKMIQITRLLDIAPRSTAQDAAGRIYASRVSCQVDRTSASVSIEPGDDSGLEYRIRMEGE